MLSRQTAEEPAWHDPWDVRNSLEIELCSHGFTTMVSCCAPLITCSHYSRNKLDINARNYVLAEILGSVLALIPRLILGGVVFPTFLKDGRGGRATRRAGVFDDVVIQRTSEQSLRVGQSTSAITRAVTLVTFCLPLVRIMSIIDCLTSIMHVHAREGLLTNLSATALVPGEWATRSTVGTSNPNLDALNLEDGQGELTSGFYFDRDRSRFRVMKRALGTLANNFGNLRGLEG